MKILNLSLLLLVLAATVSGQEPAAPSATDAPMLAVTKFSCRQEVFVPALYDDPMQINQDYKELVRDQKATAQENSNRARQGQAAIPPPTKKVAAGVPVGSTPMGVAIGDEPIGNKNLPSHEGDGGPSSVYYLYEAKVSNRGEKPISAVSWDYAVVDVENNVEVGRRSFKNVVNIKPGKSASLVRRSRNPPSSVVRVSKSGEARSQYVERVIIDRVEYVDGTFWQRPAN